MKFFKIALVLFIIQNATAQEPPIEQPNTIENQFIELYKNSNNYQIYKVIKKNEYLTLQKNILDSIKVIKTDAASKQTTIDEQQNNISKLQAKIATLNKDLTSSIDKEDTISFIGIPLNKVTYNSIVWGIIVALLIGLAFFIYRFNNSNIVTKETKSLLAETEEEFELHKRKSLEKEQKLRRQLQDEINKQRGVN